MATYKVIQDIEAEDKLLGPLTLRQFIYAGLMALCLYLSFIALTKNADFLLVIFIPIAVFFGFFAFPWKLNQPTEVWALAKIRFLLIPHRRVWDQSGVKQLVTITAPKKIETHYTDKLSPSEVKSRLQILAKTIDTRGWAIKDANVNLTDNNSVNLTPTADRLIGPSDLPTEVSGVDIQAADDMLDPENNPVAMHFTQMISDASVLRRDKILDMMKQTSSQVSKQAPPAIILDSTREKKQDWFLKNPSSVNQQGQNKLSKHAPKMTTTPKDPVDATSTRTMTPQPSPGILKLANNNDLNVATIARQANNEVIISLR